MKCIPQEPTKPERGETLLPPVPPVPEPAGVKLKRKVSSLFKKRNATDVAVIGAGGGGGGDAVGTNGGDPEPAARRSILKKPPTRSPGTALHQDSSILTRLVPCCFYFAIRIYELNINCGITAYGFKFG